MDLLDYENLRPSSLWGTDPIYQKGLRVVHKGDTIRRGPNLERRKKVMIAGNKGSVSMPRYVSTLFWRIELRRSA